MLFYVVLMHVACTYWDCKKKKIEQICVLWSQHILGGLSGGGIGNEIGKI